MANTERNAARLLAVAAAVLFSTGGAGIKVVCLTSAIRRLPALEISLLLLLEPVLNPMWTWIIRSEAPEGWTIIGGAVIVGATAVKVVYDASRRERRPVPPAG